MDCKLSDSPQYTPKLFYGWIVVIALTFVGMTSAAQLTFGIYVLDLAREFGWNRTLTSSLASFNNLFYGISAIITGILADRYSPKITVWVAGFLLGGGLLLSGMAHSYWQLFFFFGVIAGLGMGCCYSIPSSVVQNWFIEKRGVALGVSMCGIGLGAFIISLLVGYLIPIYGWRTGFFAEGTLLFLFMFVPAFFIVREPRQIGLLPLGMKNNHPGNGLNKPHPNLVLLIKKLISNRTFLYLYGNQFFTCIALLIVSTHVVPFAEDMGIPKLAAASAMGLVGLFSGLGRLQAGFVCDKIGFKKSLIIFCSMCCIAFLYLMTVKNLWMLYIFVAIYSLGYGGKAMSLPGLAGYSLGTGSLGTIMGLISSAFGLGGFIGSILGGWIFDHTHSYVWAFIAGAFCYVIAIICAYLTKKETLLEEIN
ncbi:MAG TPA: hypothetical protein DEH07_07320 [Desulfotomaculum sp.]|nr:hypothetical protein [Desulfotomaculum sp.]